MLRIFTQSLKVITIAALAIVVVAAGAWAFSYATEVARPSDAGQPVMVTVFEDQTDSELADDLATARAQRQAALDAARRYHDDSLRPRPVE